MGNNVKNPNGLAQRLDGIFKITERGSSIGDEVVAGIGAFCIAVCALLMNTQVVGTYYGNYAGAYLAVSLMALAGTLLLGIICNLPLLQTANMGMSAALIALLGSNTGLTYANIMLVTFIAAIIYLVIVVTPLKKVFVDALPDGVRKAMPVVIGLYVVYTALHSSGLLTADGTIASAKDLTNLDLFYYWILIGAIVLAAVYMAAGRKAALSSTYLIMILVMWVGGIVFYLEYFVGGQTATTLVYQRLNLIFATDGAAPYNIALGISSAQFGQLFASGFDFSAYTEAGGNAALFIIESVMTFLFLGLYTNLGTIDGSMAAGDIEAVDEAATNKALAIGAAINVISPLLGGTPVAIGSQSAVQTRDGARTGFSSVVAGIGFLIAAFNWIFYAIFATSTNGVGMWINDSETKLAAYVQDGFVFADLIMVFAGLAMLKAIKAVDVKRLEEFAPFAATVGAAAFTGDLVLGVAIGAVLYVIIQLIGRDRKTIRIQTIILAVVLLVYAFIAFRYGGNYVTVVNNMGFGGPPA